MTQESPTSPSPAAYPNALALAEALKARGYRVGKSKVYDDIKARKLIPNPDGSISAETAETYAMTLKLADGGGESKKAVEKLQKRRLQLMVATLEEDLEAKRRKSSVEQGLLVERDEVDRILAGAVMVLKADMRNFVYSRAREILHVAGGQPGREAELVAFLNGMVTDWFNRFGAEAVFTVRFGGDAAGPNESAPAEAADA